MNLNRIKALVIKEFHQIKRDPSSFLIALIFPIMLLFLYGYGVSLDLTHLKVGLFLQDESSESLSFASSLKNSQFFSIYSSQDESELKSMLTSGKIHGIIVVPFYFHQKYQQKDAAPIFVIADGESPNTASFVQNYVEGAWMNWMIQMNLENENNKSQAAVLEPRFWFNPQLSSHYFLIPGSIAIIMTLVGTLLTALVVAREWERGTMEALLATPVTTHELLLSKMISYFVLGILSFLFCFFVSIFLFEVPFRGSISFLMLAASFFLITALSGGLFISTVTKDQFIASQIAIMSSFLPAYSLSGFIFEVTSMPILIQIISNFIPAKYFVSSLQTLYLAGDVKSLVFSNIFSLFLLAMIPISLVLKKFKKRIN